MEVTWGHISLRYFLPRSVNCVDTTVRRGDIYYADLSPVVGSEQGGVRPVLIVQNDTGNRHSPTVIAAAITSDSIVLLEQIRTLDKKRLRERMGRVDSAVMEKVDAAIAVSFGLTGSHLV